MIYMKQSFRQKLRTRDQCQFLLKTLTCLRVYRIRKPYVMRCEIWYHWYNLKNVGNTHEGLVKLKALACTVTKSNTPP